MEDESLINRLLEGAIRDLNLKQTSIMASAVILITQLGMRELYISKTVFRNCLEGRSDDIFPEDKIN